MSLNHKKYLKEQETKLPRMESKILNSDRMLVKLIPNTN